MRSRSGELLLGHGSPFLSEDAMCTHVRQFQMQSVTCPTPVHSLTLSPAPWDSHSVPFASAVTSEDARAEGTLQEPSANPRPGWRRP